MRSTYTFTGETLEHNGHTLRRIRATENNPLTYSPNELGGWIETEANLADGAWVAGHAKVYGDAFISNKACVTDTAEVCGNARIYADAIIGGAAKITDDAVVSVKAKVEGSAEIGGDTLITTGATVTGSIKLTGGIVTARLVPKQGTASNDIRIRRLSDSLYIDFRDGTFISVFRTTSDPWLCTDSWAGYLSEAPEDLLTTHRAAMKLVKARVATWKTSLSNVSHKKPRRFFEYTGEKLEHKGRTLRRIRALTDMFSNVEKGDLGGWIESEANLISGWVADNAKVYDNAEVFFHSIVADNAEVYGNATLHGSGVGDDAEVFGNASLAFGAVVAGTSKVFGYARAGTGIQLMNCTLEGIIHGYGDEPVLIENLTLGPEILARGKDEVVPLSVENNDPLLFLRTTTGHTILSATWSGTLNELPAQFDITDLEKKMAAWTDQDGRIVGTDYYQFTGKTLTHAGHTLNQIKATQDIRFLGVHAGEIGGWVESKENLLNGAWVYPGSKVYGNAKVSEYSEIYDGDNRVHGNAVVIDSKLYSDSVVFGHAVVTESNLVFGAHIQGNAQVKNCDIDGARVFARAQLEAVDVSRPGEIGGDFHLNYNEPVGIGPNAHCTEPGHVVVLPCFVGTTPLVIYRTATSAAVTMGKDWSGDAKSLKNYVPSNWEEFSDEPIDRKQWRAEHAALLRFISTIRSSWH